MLYKIPILNYFIIQYLAIQARKPGNDEIFWEGVEYISDSQIKILLSNDQIEERMSDPARLFPKSINSFQQ